MIEKSEFHTRINLSNWP